MALRPFVGFVGPSYTEESKIAADDETVNWYPSRVESGTGPATYVLYPTPGFFPQATGLDSPGRGGLQIFATTTNGQNPIYFVSGGTLYLFPSTVLATGIVEDATATPVTIVTNGEQGGFQLLFASGGNGYCYDTQTDTLTVIGQGNAVAFLNGYGILLNTSTNRFFYSDLFDFATWDPLDVVVREDASDNWQTVLAFREELWLFGAVTTSIYYNDGDDPDIPWKPNQSAFIQMGTYSPYAVCVVDGSPMWLGRDANGAGIVYRAQGYTPQRISTHAIEYAIQSGAFGVPTLAEICTRQQNGHVFGEMTLPALSVEGGTLGSTFVYDSTDGLWHREGLWDGLQFQEKDTRGYFGLGNAGLTLSRTEGKVFSVVPTYGYDTDGNPIVRERRAPHINIAQRRIRYSRLRLVMETGLGSGSVPSTDPAFDPLMTLSWSNDGGQTFGADFPISTGRIGAYSQLVEWFQLEQAQDRVFKFRTSSPTPQRLVDAFLEYSVGPT